MLSRPIRTLAPASVFVGELFRQPWLLFIVILGPFLILLLFVVGARVYRDFPTTIIVQPAQPPSASALQVSGKELDNFLHVVDVTQDREAALARLRRGEVKLVLELPPEPAASVANGQQAQIKISTNEIDPLANSFFTLFVESQIAELNRQVIERTAAQTHDSLGRLRADVDRAALQLDGLQTGSVQEQRQRLAEASRQPEQIDAALGQVQQTVRLMVGPVGSIAGTPLGEIQRLREQVARLRDEATQLDAQLARAPSPQEAARMRQDVGQLQQVLAQAQAANPTVLSAPFAATVTNVAPYVPEGTNYFLPGVLALVVQHLALTLAAVSIARDRRLGLFDLYRLSPASPAELLLGKYLGLILMVALIAAAITGLAIVALQLPVLGGLPWLASALFVFVLTALAYGFVIGLLTGSEESAIQVAMLALIASVAFGGLLAPLEQLTKPLLAAAYLLPVTSGKVIFEAVLFRGYFVNWLAPAVLSLLLLVAFALSFRLFARELARR
jgi:ABC-2 type transport system permease protein